MVTHIYYWGITNQRGYPEIDFSKQPNNAFDWHSIGQMLDGERAIDSEVISKVNIEVKSRIKDFDVLRLSARRVVSERSKSLLQSLSLEGLIWVPLRVNNQPFYVLRVELVIDCLDRSNSKIQFYPSNPAKVMMIRKYSLDKSRIPEAAIFRIPESSRIFVTPVVKDRIEGRGINGFRFFDIENPPRDEPIG